VTGATGVSCACHFLSRVFLDYFHFFFRPFAVLRPVFACPHGQLRLFAHPFPRILALFLRTHHTPSGPLAPKVFHSPASAIQTLFPSGTAIRVYPEPARGCALRSPDLRRKQRGRAHWYPLHLGGLHADTRGYLDAAVRVHRFGEFARFECTMSPACNLKWKAGWTE